MNNNIILIAGLFLSGCSQTAPKSNIKPLLIEELNNSYSNKNWFVPVKLAIQDLSIEKVNWKDTSDNHSIGELVSHLIFWNERVLISFKGNKPPAFDDNNKSTFVKYSGDEWKNNLLKLDSIQKKWLQAVSEANDSLINKSATTVMDLCTHMAYHTGQILYIRKRNGWWKESDGVK